MLILGIDPGTATTGWGLIEKLQDKDFEILEWGLIETKKETAPHIRLHEIHEQMLSILDKYRPNVLVMEKVFMFNNAKTVIRVSQAQGVILLASSSCGFDIEVYEYAPQTIKKLITGSGRAKKKEMDIAVHAILGNKLDKKDLKDGFGKSRKMTKTYVDNAIDALAIAMSHLMKLQEDILSKQVPHASRGGLRKRNAKKADK
ncbi:MAG TPA: crossover junction endodeoxyribonuclease RuvC [Patescibacteria group bacterium]|nr:crossover junction endodeoxyribonuclease RuvC [Patescibacteria group bacterium]